ncbi:TonB-dependent receptor plug domain-containing protein [Uliginosibacterium sp. H1]|uniref:TonB-dependent receptor plug domain-containing protein n=1 Tax=Uliginosibacterium sp. H1 TaxID=3114757 RepID=UPI002E19BE93|nr:TonB-dependent receptor [Uliginosibacterium sp. H1]
MRKHWKRWRLSWLILVGSGAHAAGLEEEDLSQIYGDKTTVSVATGSAQPVARAPSVASVFTAADIEAMGARDLDDVLTQVPGLQIVHTFGTIPVYAFRGIYSQYNQQVLVLINGVPMTSAVVGDRGNLWSSVPVDNIARIEVVRGPGSALYGAEAMAGVISIFTKDPDFQPGTTVRADAGSFDTYSGSLRQTGRIGGLSAAGFLRIGRSTGNDASIDADAQTSLDGLFGTRASHAPGPMTNTRRELDAAIDLKYSQFQFRSAYKKRGDLGTGSGVADALDPTGRNESEQLTADLTWAAPKLTETLGATVQLQYADRHEYSDLVLFPPGSFGGSFPQGMIGRPEKWERRSAVNGSLLYTGLKDHRARVGVGYVDQDIYRIKEQKNYTYVYVPGNGYVPVPLGGIQDVSDTAPFLRPHARQIQYAYLQDEWQMIRDLTLTAGIRHDDYSDFGGTTNPRLALVWDAAYNVTTKLLYGRAFRPPSFAELYNINNPVAVGNPNLKPETIETVEAAISWQIDPRTQVGFNVFQYDMEDILRFVPNGDPSTGNTAQNAGRLRGKGFELEGSWDPVPRLHLAGNYSYQDAVDPETDRPAANVPQHRFHARADWQFLPGWWLSPQLTHITERPRDAGDTRVPLDGYTLADLVLRNTSLIPKGAINFVIRNLGDADARDPSPSPGRIPGDIPLPGRSYYVSVTYGF